MTFASLFSVEKLKLDEEHLILCDLRWDLDHLLADMKKRGLWWIVPLGRTYGRDILGTRLTPLLSPQKAPVEFVAVQPRNVVTIASSPAHVVENRLASTPGNLEAWDSIAKMPEAGWKQLGALHDALGGTPSHWAQVRKRLTAMETRRECADQATPMSKRREAITKLWSDLDPPSAPFRKYVLDAREDDEAPVPVPQCGPFQVALNSVAFCVRESAGDDDEAAIVADYLFMYPPNLDAWTLGGSPSIFPEVAVEAMRTYRKIAQHVPSTSRLFALAKAVKEAPASYDGKAHLAAASDLASDGEPVMAYVLAIGASYFEKAREEAFRFVVDLARRQSWREVSEVLARWESV